MATWPSDSLPRPSPFEMDPGRVVAYFLSPSGPEFELVESHIRAALLDACGSFGMSSRLERAITSTSPVIVHDDIWNALYNADVLVYDITGENGSVMMELGVGSAWRLKPQVLVLQNKGRSEGLPFNLSPARTLRYDLSPRGLRELHEHATEAFRWSLSTLPVSQATKHPREEVLPFRLPENAADLVTPPLCHRHQRTDGSLEFGAPHVFRHSFAMPHTGSRRDMKLVAEMNFLDRLKSADPGSGWIGFKLLGSGVLMNHGVGAVVRPDGSIQVTYQESEKGPYRDPKLKRKLKPFDPARDRVKFEATVSGSVFRFQVSTSRAAPVGYQLNLVRKAHYRPTSGVCLLQAYRCRAVISRLVLR